MKRRKGLFWEYNGDGQFSTERLGKFWKRYWRKWAARNFIKREMEHFNDK